MKPKKAVTALERIRPAEQRFLSRGKGKRLKRLTPFCFAGLCYFGLLFSMLSLYTPLVYRKVLFPVVLMVFLLTSLVCLNTRHSGKILTGTSLLTLTAAFLLRHPVKTGVLQLCNTVYSNAHHTELAYFSIAPTENPAACATLVCCLLSVLLACFYTYFTIRRPAFLLTALTAFVCMEIGFYEGLSLHPLAFAPLFAGECGMFAYCHSLRHTPADSAGRQAARGSGSAAAWMTLCVYLAVIGTGSLCGYARTEEDRIRMRNLSRSLSSFDIQNIPESIRSIGTSLGFLKDTNVSKLGRTSHLEYQDKEILTLTFDTLPDSTMYLKGFTGSTYTDNSWKKLSEDASADYQRTMRIITEYGCTPQNFSYLFQRTLLPDTDTFQCTVTAVQRDGRYYQPYASYSETASYSDDSGCMPEVKNDYTWTVSAPQSWVIHDIAEADIQKTEMSKDGLSGSSQVHDFLSALGHDSGSFTMESLFPLSAVENIPDSIRGKVIPALMLDTLLYRDVVRDVYTRLPENDALDEVYAAMPEELASLQPKTAMEQYTALGEIRDWMSECAVYDLSPGKTPRTRDFVNFFLLENQKGYCKHFATAGTILARHLGIPARYCEGYVVGKDILEQAETDSSGKTTLTLTDRQSHAWCEFYIDGYGWMPFEMTPGYYISAPVVSTTQPSDEEPQATETVTTQTTAATGSSVTNTTTAVLPPAETTVSTRSDNGRVSFGLFPMLRKLLFVLGILGIAAAAAISLVFLHRLLCRHRYQSMKSCRNPKKAILYSYRYFVRLMRHLGLPYQGGLLTEYSQKAQALLRKKHLPDDVPERVISAALAADMSGKPPTDEMVHHTAEAVLSLAESMSQSENPLKRLCLKYIFHLF